MPRSRDVLRERRPDSALVGRTWADLVRDSKTGPQLDTALAGMLDFVTTGPGRAWARITGVLQRLDRKLEAAGVEPKAIPERVAIPVMQPSGWNTATNCTTCGRTCW